MSHLFYKYVLLYKKVFVPGIGVFTLSEQPAEFSFESNVFTAPRLRIGFNENGVDSLDDMYRFIAEETGVDEGEAKNTYRFFSRKVQDDLQTQRRAELPGLGFLILNEHGEITFSEEVFYQNYYPDVSTAHNIASNTSAQNVHVDTRNGSVRQTAASSSEPTETRNAKRYWLVIAIVILVLVLAVILYFVYLQQGLL